MQDIMRRLFFGDSWTGKDRELVEQDLRELELAQERGDSRRAYELTQKLMGDLREANSLPREWEPEIEWGH